MRGEGKGHHTDRHLNYVLLMELAVLVCLYAATGRQEIHKRSVIM